AASASARPSRVSWPAKARTWPWWCAPRTCWRRGEASSPRETGRAPPRPPPGGAPGATRPIENLVDQDLLHDFTVKYVGALRCCRAAIPFMKEQRWGRIINISGLNARNAGNLSGGARNTSLVHLSKTLAVQLGRFGITV